MEKELEEILTNISKNPKNKVAGKEVITVSNGVDEHSDGDITPMPVVTFNSNEKYAKIHGKFGRTAILNEDLNSLLDYFVNHDYILI